MRAVEVEDLCKSEEQRDVPGARARRAAVEPATTEWIVGPAPSEDSSLPPEPAAAAPQSSGHSRTGEDRSDRLV